MPPKRRHSRRDRQPSAHFLNNIVDNAHGEQKGARIRERKRAEGEPPSPPPAVSDGSDGEGDGDDSGRGSDRSDGEGDSVTIAELIREVKSLRAVVDGRSHGGAAAPTRSRRSLSADTAHRRHRSPSGSDDDDDAGDYRVTAKGRGFAVIVDVGRKMRKGLEARGLRTARAWFDTVSTRVTIGVRDRHECLSLASIIDAGVSQDQLSDDSAALERAWRRLHGIVHSCKTGDRKYCDAVQLEDDDGLLLPPEDMLVIAKAAKALGRDTATVAPAGAGGDRKKKKFGGARGGARSGGGSTAAAAPKGGGASRAPAKR